MNGVNNILQGQNPFEAVALPLAAAIRAAKERYEAQSQPLPTEVKAALKGHFEQDILNATRWTVGNIEITLPNFIGQGRKFFNNDSYAVVVDNIIVFNTAPGSWTQNSHWWAHEVTHVEQYKKWGIENFSYRYLKDFGGKVEKEANNRANSILGQPIMSISSDAYALHVGSFDRSSSDIDADKNFDIDPEIYVAQCIFPHDQAGVNYLVTNYGRIIAVNPKNGQWWHVGYSTPPRLQNVAWSYDIPHLKTSYAVGMDGKIYNPVPIINAFGQAVNYQWNVIGYVSRL